MGHIQICRRRASDPSRAERKDRILISQHLGSLHPFEQALTITLALGPFLVLGIVIAIRRRAERAEEERTREIDERAAESGGHGSSG